MEDNIYDVKNNGINSLIIGAINDEWEAIRFYEDLLVNNTDEKVAKIVQDILNEEHNHVGMLEEVLKEFSEEAEKISDGEQEAQEIISGDIQEEDDEMRIKEALEQDNNLGKIKDVVATEPQPFVDAIDKHNERKKRNEKALKDAGKEDELKKPFLGQKKPILPPKIQEKLTLDEATFGKSLDRKRS